MPDRFEARHTEADIEHFFPVPSATSASDKLFLLGAMRLVREAGAYRYLEIGSHLGGSLTPFLMDPTCEAVFSIDDRGRVQPDERGISFDYTGITTQTMIDELHRKGITTENLNAIDGSITDIEVSDAGLFDLSFIDGEHTDEACFRDFIWTFPMMKLDSIMAFHDSSLIYKSQKLILIYLDKMKVAYTFFKRADSEVSALVFGKYRAASLEGYLGPMEDQTVFFATSEARRIEESIHQSSAATLCNLENIQRAGSACNRNRCARGPQGLMIGQAAHKFVDRRWPGARASRPI